MIILIKKPLNYFFYIFSTSLNGFFLLFWLITFSGLVLKRNKNVFLICSIILLVLLEVIYFSLFFFLGQSALIVSVERGLWVKSTLFVIFFLGIIIAIFFLTAIAFIITALKSDNKQIKLKGEILLLGLICLILGTIFESVIPLVGIVFIFTRIFQILGVLFIFIGFTLPKWVKKLFNLEIID